MDAKHPLVQQLHEAFTNTYGSPPAVTARAPGRVNLIGEHTDYNDGFVLPMAIDREICFAASARKDREVHLHFLDFEQSLSFDLDSMQRGPSSPVEYIKGVAHFLEQEGFHLPGLNGVITGSIPISAGLSSSAALELAAVRVFFELAGAEWDPTAAAKFALEAERRWVGLNCGIMDQLISACGHSGHALLIDCRSLDTTPAPLPPGITVIVLDTGTRRSGSGLVDSAYGERRMQCEQAAAVLGVPALRDAALQDLQSHSAEMDPVVLSRARHVITENERTLAAHRAMMHNKPETLGALMDAGHESLQRDFEVSTPALDAIAEIARAHPASFGARMTGAGFGGCAVAVVRSGQVQEFMDHVRTGYQTRMNLEPQLYACKASKGASLLP